MYRDWYGLKRELIMYDINVIALKEKLYKEYSIYIIPERIDVYIRDIERFAEFYEPLDLNLSFESLKMMIADYVINLSIKYAVNDIHASEYYDSIERYIEAYVESLLNVNY